MKILKEYDDIIIFQPKEVFDIAISEHGDWIKNYMYMHSSKDGLTHHFKNINTRQYVTINF